MHAVQAQQLLLKTLEDLNQQWEVRLQNSLAELGVQKEQEVIRARLALLQRREAEMIRLHAEMEADQLQHDGEEVRQQAAHRQELAQLHERSFEQTQSLAAEHTAACQRVQADAAMSLCRSG